MPIIGSEGAASSKGFGQFALSTAANYIEEVFSTYLYTGNGSTQTITNGIDLAGKGGLVWIKRRDFQSHILVDTARGGTNILSSNNTDAQSDQVAGPASFGATGFTLLSGDSGWNQNTFNYASWTFRKQPKFFDIVTYTGDGEQLFPGRAINHNLGSVPGCIMIKNLTRNSDWHVEHRSANQWISGSFVETLALNSTSAQSPSAFGYGCLPIATSTTFNVVGNSDAFLFPVNYAGDQYVAYLFAHNAGGFGLTGTDNVISCGSYTGNGSITGPVINLGYEPQWLLIKNATTGGEGRDWVVRDIMRGLPVGNNSQNLFANLANAETSNLGGGITITPTGWSNHDTDPAINTNGNTYIYIAIRRGPMRVPTTGTSVYKTVLSNPTNSGTSVTGAGFPPDLNLALVRNGSSFAQIIFDRLRGGSQYLSTASTGAEGSVPSNRFLQDGFLWGSSSGENIANTFMRRAPGFFDVVCYRGAAGSITVNHNLGVAPELIITKVRNLSYGWFVKPRSTLGLGDIVLQLNLGNAPFPSPDASSTATTMTFNDGGYFNLGAGYTYVAYLFATCPGVSKVGSYTGNGTSQTINCGFTGGARFVLIKNASESDNWYVFDTARGIVSGADPYIRLNSTLAEASEDFIDPNASGFAVEGNDPGSNRSGNQYIFLAIA
jgi:hypothetical protein